MEYQDDIIASMTRLTKQVKRDYAASRKYFKTRMGGGYVLPRLTHKYFNAVATLSDLDGTSRSIFHLTAAQRGTKIFYDALEKMGYRTRGRICPESYGLEGE